MKRTLIYLLVVLLIAAGVGTLIARDPGYVMVSWDGVTVETGLWIALALLMVTGVLIYYLLRLLAVLRGSGSRWRGWRAGRRRNRAADMTARGIRHLEGGEYERAERFLLEGADDNAQSAVNFILAARAADAQGRPERRDEFLHRALDRDPSARQAVAVARAEMAAARNQWRECLASLEDCEDNPRVLGLKREALFRLRDWHGLIELLPRLRKMTDDSTKALEFEKEVAIARLSEDMNDEARKVVFRKLQDRLRKDPDVVLAYCRHSDDEKAAETRLRKAVNEHWHVDLLLAYGALGDQTLDKRIKTARGWLKDHADDYALQLCLGELYLAKGEQEQARACFQKSMDIRPTARASERLGELSSFDGDDAASARYYRQALKLSRPVADQEPVGRGA